MLTFTVIENAPQDGFAILRVQVGSDRTEVTTGDTFNLAVTPAIAALNEVGQPLVLNTKERTGS